MALERAVQLADAIFTLERMTEAHVICARTPFAAGSAAMIVELAEDYAVPAEVTDLGYSYFLGAEDVAQLISQVSGTLHSREDQVAVICHFATYDAYPDWFNRLLPNRTLGGGNAT
jgi:hypothetical protein